ncbi:MAG: hypothetical protein ABIL25_06440 [candidate division WOR-3 bacterium]
MNPEIEVETRCGARKTAFGFALDLTALHDKITSSTMGKNRKMKLGQSRREMPGFWLWIVTGLVVLFLLFMLARTLSHTAVEPAPIPLLATAQQDLVSLTRMLGEIEPDTFGFGSLPAEICCRLKPTDSLIAEQNWPEAIAELHRCLKRVPDRYVSAVHACLGFCYYHSASLDRSLAEFRKAFQLGALPRASVVSPLQHLSPPLSHTTSLQKEEDVKVGASGVTSDSGHRTSSAQTADSGTSGTPHFELAADDSTGRGLRARAAFAIAYLFQSRGFPDSAEYYYFAARALLPDSSPLLAAVLNNIGVIRETRGDTTGARKHYAAAAVFCDTVANTPSARTLRDNLRRLTR